MSGDEDEEVEWGQDDAAKGEGQQQQQQQQQEQEKQEQEEEEEQGLSAPSSPSDSPLPLNVPQHTTPMDDTNSYAHTTARPLNRVFPSCD